MSVEPKIDLLDAGDLTRVLAARVPGFRSLRSCERLSGGASQETYRIVVDTDGGERRLAMHRAPARMKTRMSEIGPGLAVEAELMQAARAAGVPEPEIVHV